MTLTVNNTAASASDEGSTCCSCCDTSAQGQTPRSPQVVETLRRSRTRSARPFQRLSLHARYASSRRRPGPASPSGSFASAWRLARCAAARAAPARRAAADPAAAGLGRCAPGPAAWRSGRVHGAVWKILSRCLGAAQRTVPRRDTREGRPRRPQPPCARVARSGVLTPRFPAMCCQGSVSFGISCMTQPSRTRLSCLLVTDVARRACGARC